jgi:hypothetical protein
MRSKNKTRVILSQAKSASLGKLRAEPKRRCAQLGIVPKKWGPEGRRQYAAARDLSSEIEIGASANRQLATTKVRLLSSGLTPFL